MKKSLVALAVLAATGAYAQSSVTLYGIVEATTDIGYNRNLDTRATVNNFNALNVLTSTVLTPTTIRQRNSWRIQDGNDQGTGTSRVGFRGTEDLGGGLKANFVLEMGLRIDDGCTTLGSAAACANGGGSGESGGATFGRNAWGGLSGGFGEVRLGRQVLGSFGVQANSWSAGSSNGLYDAGAGLGILMGGVRFSNAIRYMTPNFDGFRGSLMLSAPETGVNVNTFSAPVNSPASRRVGVDLALEYANGPAYIGFGYNRRDLGNITTTTTGVTTVNVTPANVNGYTLGGAYDFGVVKPFINYTRQRTDLSGSTVAPAFNVSGTNASNADARALSIGLRAPVGAFTVIAGIGRAITDTDSASVATTVTNVSTFTVATQQERRDTFQLGAQYALSKRTLVEANYGYNRLRTNSVAVVTTNGLPSPPVVGGRQERFVDANDRTSALNVGLKHSF